jgi:hypothetical protein
MRAQQEIEGEGSPEAEHWTESWVSFRKLTAALALLAVTAATPAAADPGTSCRALAPPPRAARAARCTT